MSTDTLEAPAVAPLSTEIDTDPGPSAGGGGKPDLGNEPSLRETLSTIVKDEKPDLKDAKAPDHPKDDDPKPGPAKDEDDDAKPDNADDGDDKPKPDDAEKPDEEKAEAKPDAKGERRHVDPPSKFLPRAKELWRNTPREVQAEVDRVVRETEAAAEQFRASHERYETVRDFDELARSNGRELRESLMQVHQIEQVIQRNPLAGIEMILAEIGPRKADGSPVSLYEIAQHVVQQGPQTYAQPQQQQPREDPQVAQLKQQLAEMQQQTVAQTVIEPFRADHPRYDELSADIAMFLNSGKVPASLSPQERLATAYDMAERINPPSSPPDNDDEPDLETESSRAASSLSGTRSIKSAPGSVTEDVEVAAKPDESIRDSLRKVLKRAR